MSSQLTDLNNCARAIERPVPSPVLCGQTGSKVPLTGFPSLLMPHLTSESTVVALAHVSCRSHDLPTWLLAWEGALQSQ